MPEYLYLSKPGAICVESALVRACYLLSGTEMGDRVLKFIQNMPVRAVMNKLADFSDVIHKYPANIEIIRLKQDEKDEYAKNKTPWVCKKASGIWIVQIVAKDILDHAVLVDGVQKVIYD